eukprot:TRINITY_DN605_c0_g1_i1.p1 TRINITY_DN605_c0_g1~~TRINITY_DN605_c0_g1_i1.p1  ORF type:complete len:950 (-),score=238.78 TRINITY_DN605_c0_g1_i1:2570-5419(-)
MADLPCNMIIHADSSEPVQIHKLKEKLEKGSDDDKIDALKKTIIYLLGGESAPQLVISIIRYVMPSKNHKIKKLLLLYWEVLDAASKEGMMLLVCNGLLRDVNYPNEYVRGSTMRFLCKLKDTELLQPLVESIRNNLEHRHAYVKRNAVLAIYSIYKDLPHLIPDAPDLIYDFLQKEGDPSCKRNAFIMLFNCARDKAIEYLSTVLDQVQSFGEILQLIVVEMIRKVVKNQSRNRGRYIRCIFSLLTSSSHAVQYEAAHTLVTLSSAPTAIKAAASTYINLLVRESDNNVKMIVLGRLMTLKETYPKILQNLVMDVLRALSSPDMDIRNKTLSISLGLVTPNNIREVIALFKKEIHKSQSETFQDGGEYRHMLIKAVHTCAVKFPDVAADVVHDLIEYLGDDNVNAAADVIEFVREVIQTYPDLRKSLVDKLVASLYQIKSSRVFRAALWIVGEYPESNADVDASFRALQEVIGDAVSLASKPSEAAQSQPESAQNSQPSIPQVVYTGPRVLADGTYASSTSLSFTTTAPAGNTSSAPTGPALKQLLLTGDFFLATSLATALVKLSLKKDKVEADALSKNAFRAKVLLYLTSLLQLINNFSAARGGYDSDQDSQERIETCIKILAIQSSKVNDTLNRLSRQSLSHYLKTVQLGLAPKKEEEEANVVKNQVDELVKFKQLKGADGLIPDSGNMEEQDDLDLDKVTGVEEEDYSTRLSRMIQLTGFSDPIYCEAYVNVHQYDILLDVTVVNQTSDTLQNLSLELSTLGDLKLLERPTNYTLGPYAKKNIKANIKVSSTETGIIFGSIVYDIAGTAQTEKIVTLNEIHIDIIDYITPATTDENTFRKMWAEFEWENKVAVNTNFTNLKDFLDNIIKATNMKCLTPASSLEGECGFLSANLYAKSAFDEDALANVSVELQNNGKIAGLIRIRSKTQGIAISLGEKITQKQKGQ